MLDVLDRVLTKGIVINTDAETSTVGPRVIEIAGHTAITSLETCTHMTAPLPNGETTQTVVSAAEQFLSDLPMGGAPHLPRAE